jgi:hypothetical protein
MVLHNIWQMIDKLRRRGKEVRLGKVRAHTGVEGNETADKLAKQAAEGQCDDVITDGNSYYKQLTLLGATGNGGTRYITNVRKYVETAVGDQEQKGIYAKLWKQTAPHIDDKHTTSAVLDTKPTPTRVLVLKYHWGVLYNNKLALRYGHPWANGGKCPLPGCHGQDSVGHMTGECAHPAIKSIIIKAHHQVTYRILKAIKKGAYGNYAALADAGQSSEQYTVGSTNPPPAWMEMAHNVSRPDILLLKGMPEHTATQPNPNRWYKRHKPRIEHHVIEVPGLDPGLQLYPKLRR